MTRRQAARAVDLFAAATIASVGVALAALTWRIVAGVPSAAPPMPVVAVPRAEVDVSPILAQAPFGNGANGAPTPTSLPVELRGVILSMTPSGSSALIAPAGGAALSYAIGQAIPGGATLESIGLDHVILAVGGHRELLAFPRAGAPAPAPSPTAPPPSGAPIIVGGAVVAGPPPPPPAPPPGGSFAASPQSVLEGLAATPMPNGYRIGDGIAPAYRQSGLQPGDVIEQVNGTKLGNPAADQQVLAQAVRGGNVRIDLLRGDRRMTLSFPVR